MNLIDWICFFIYDPFRHFTAEPLKKQNLFLKVSTYFICFTMVLFPDSPAPEERRKERQWKQCKLNSNAGYIFIDFFLKW